MNSNEHDAGLLKMKIAAGYKYRNILPNEVASLNNISKSEVLDLSFWEREQIPVQMTPVYFVPQASLPVRTTYGPYPPNIVTQVTTQSKPKPPPLPVLDDSKDAK